MRLATYNVNGIRAAIGKGLVSWIATKRPDILCLQELKAQSEQIPEELFQSLGYHCYWACAQRKGYSGVGILSLRPPCCVLYGIGIESFDIEGRLLRADFDNVSVVCVYFPNGYACEQKRLNKLRWLDCFYEYACNLIEEHPRGVFSGDFNICHDDLDAHEVALKEENNKLFLLDERMWFTKLLKIGVIDSFRYINPNVRQFTWWSIRTKARLRNHGWRIDYHLIGASLSVHLCNAWIESETMLSDHCPTWIELNI